MNRSLMQSNALEAVRERFQEGGSFWDIFWFLFALAGVLAGLALFQRVQQHGTGARVVQNPGKLFRGVTKRLRVGVLQRDLLYRMAGELKLEQPTVLLLSPALFGEYARQWLDQIESRPSGGGAARNATTKSLNDLCHAIFGVRPGIASRSPE